MIPQQHTPHDDPDRLLTVDDLCRLWGVKKSWIYDEVESGRLPVVRLGRQLRFQRTALNGYLSTKA